MTRLLKWHEYTSSWSLLPIKNSSLPPFPDGLNFVHYDGKKSISQLCRHTPWVWLQNFYQSHELNVTPLLYTLTLYIWFSVHWMTHKLSVYLESLKVLLSTTMELLEYWWRLFNCDEGRGHDDKFMWKMKLSATR